MGTPALGHRDAEGRVSGERPSVDLVHLSRQTMGDRQLESELLGLFVRQARSVLATLTAATEDGLMPPWGCEPLHMLSGSARAVGCWSVGAEAQTLELDIRAAALERVPLAAAGRLAPLADAIEKACAAIDGLLADPS